MAFVAAAAMALSCSKEIPEKEIAQDSNPAQDDKSAGVPTYFSASFGETKTYIGAPEIGGEYCVKWTTKDSLAVNGKGSLKGSTTVSEDGKTVNFIVKGVEAPFCAVSPLTVCKGEEFDPKTKTQILNVNGTSSPQYHEYVENPTFSPKAAIVAAYSPKPDSLVFKHLMTYLKITISGGTDTDNINRVYIRQNNAEQPNIAGQWKITFSPDGNHKFEPVDMTSIIKWDGKRSGHKTGLEQGNPFIVAIPAIDYKDGLIVTVKDCNDHFQSYVIPASDAQYSEKRGTIINKALAFSPASGTINSAEDWNTFAAAVNSGKDENLYRWVGNGTVKIGKDITAGDLTKITKPLTYNIDGQNKTITRTAANGPLFYTIGATVKNLALDGEMTVSSDAAAFADSLSATGSIKNCVNKMNITASGQSGLIVGGFVKFIRGGKMTDCKNEGNLTVNIDFSSANANIQLGGIAAQVENVSEADTVTLTNCINAGNLTVNPTSTVKNTALGYNGVGGIIAWCYHLKATLILDGCVNTGKIEYTGTGLNDYAANSYCCVGGIIGIGTYQYKQSTPAISLTFDANNPMKTKLVNCKNSGNIHNCFSNYSGSAQALNKIFTGGIAGSLAGNSTDYAELVGCESTGTIIPYDTYGTDASSRPAYCQVTGGLIGAGGYVKIDNAKVNCAIGNGQRRTASYGGVIGFTWCPFVMENSTVWTIGYWTSLKGYKGNGAIAFAVPSAFNTTSFSFLPNLSGSKIEKCTIGIEMHTTPSDPTAATDNREDQSGNLTSTQHWNTNDKCVCGQGYKTLTDDVTFTNVTYVTVNPFQ